MLVKRGSERHPITIQGSYRMGTGSERKVAFVNLSENGCQFYEKSHPLNPDALLSIRIETIGPFDATVRWCDRDNVGIEFKRPIYGPVFDHIREVLDNSEWRTPA